jgi:hypothetical protein
MSTPPDHVNRIWSGKHQNLFVETIYDDNAKTGYVGIHTSEKNGNWRVPFSNYSLQAYDAEQIELGFGSGPTYPAIIGTGPAANRLFVWHEAFQTGLEKG